VIRDSVSSSRLLARSVRISRTTRPCRLHVEGYGTYRAGAAFSERSRPAPTPPLPAEALTLQAARQFSLRLDLYSSSQVLQIDGCFYHHTPASLFDEESTLQQGPFAPRALPRFSATTGPAATVSPSHRFLDGARTASPVARHVLVTVLPLPPRRSDAPHQSDCDTPCCLRPGPEGSASGSYFLTRPPVGSLTLRPGDSLTIPKMALSISFTGFVSSTDVIQATGLLTENSVTPCARGTPLPVIS